MKISITSNYAGGNIKVIDLNHKTNTVKLKQDIRDTEEWWFYWNFCIKNLDNISQKIRFNFCNGEVIGPYGPAKSIDGLNWNWLGRESKIDNTSFEYNFLPDEKVYFAFSLPYQVKHFEIFCENYRNNCFFSVESIGISEKGRIIPLVRIGRTDAGKHIFFTCRHHACESTASYVLEGLMRYIIENYTNSNVLKNYLFHSVPFVDIDGVEEGDQGKNRSPHDHGRDYIENPIYNSIKCIINYVKGLKDVIVAIDFHSPWKWGDRNDYCFFVKQGSPIKEEIETLSFILEKNTKGNRYKGEIEYNSIYDLKIDQEWNKSDLPTCAKFFKDFGAKLACSFEVPYFGKENPVTQENLKKFGKDFGKSLEEYLKKFKG